MDMNWHAMLHEAANASFEKDLEALAAAPVACSCSDLPKAKIRELSEKILYLPHQGIVLLFSRYCFRLSPKETETFFQLKNTKGRFRFYRELLSSSMGLCPGQVISAASLHQACKIAMKAYLRTELNEETGVSGAGRSQTHPAFSRIGRAVAVAAITLTLLFSTVMAVNAQFRERVIAWVVGTFEKYSSFELQSGESAQADLQRYQPAYLPDGTELQDTTNLSEMIIYEFAINNSNHFEILLSKPDIKVYLDTENAEITPFDQNGLTGYYFKRDALNYVCCERDGIFLAVYGSIDTDELIKIAAGITNK